MKQERVTKETLIRRINEKLNILGITQFGCQSVNVVFPNGDRITWVSRSSYHYDRRRSVYINLYYGKNLSLFTAKKAILESIVKYLDNI